FRLVGWNRYSIGYHSDDGRLFKNDGFSGRLFGRRYGKGDTIGVGYHPTRGSVFFTLNGKVVGSQTDGASSSSSSESLRGSVCEGEGDRHPYHIAVSADGPCVLVVNFGQKEFVYEEANRNASAGIASLGLGSSASLRGGSGQQQQQHQQQKQQIIPQTMDADVQMHDVEMSDHVEIPLDG
ncbi:Rsp5p-dependent ubiquitination, sorting of cargo proteins at the multivesicular body, partial [Quaeritorhiza haematococci]